jgi:enediyne biosynthesis protein E4
VTARALVVLAAAGVGTIVVASVTGRAQAPAASAAPVVRFSDAAAATGLVFTHENGATGAFHMPELIGSGVALLDLEGDGDLDVFLVQGGPLEGSPQGGLTSRLFRNDGVRGADGALTLRFTDVTRQAGVGLRAYGMGAATGDVDGDGDWDLFVTTYGADVLYRNNGNGTFTDVTAEAGVSDPFWSTSAAFLDADRDGDLDLFVANYLEAPLAAARRCTDATGARDYCGPRAFRSAPDRLYRNDGRGRFTDVTVAAGIARADGNGLGVVTGDYDGDGWIDVYVANDATPNQLWRNQRDGTFVDIGPLSGAAVNAAGAPEGSMGLASGDYDADGDEDLAISNIIHETFALYSNDGTAAFDDVRARTGLAALTAPYTGFGIDWLDADNDGALDLLAVNGAVNTLAGQRGQPRPYRQPSLLLLNRGGRFVDASAAAGPALTAPDVSRGAAFGDLDDDGDVDAVVAINGGPVRLLLNETPRGRHWLRVRLTAPAGNRHGIGAWVGVERAGRPTLWRRVRTDGSYLSASDPRVHVGLGETTAIDAVVVQWPDGTKTRHTGVAPDRTLTLER